MSSSQPWLSRSRKAKPARGGPPPPTVRGIARRLSGFGQWMQVGGGCSVPSGACSMLRGFIRDLPRSSVRSHRGDTLQLRETGTVSEPPEPPRWRRRVGVVSGDLLDQGMDHLSALRCVARHYPGLVHRHLEVGWSRCGAFVRATRRLPGSLERRGSPQPWSCRADGDRKDRDHCLADAPHRESRCCVEGVVGPAVGRGVGDEHGYCQRDARAGAPGQQHRRQRVENPIKRRSRSSASLAPWGTRRSRYPPAARDAQLCRRPER